MTEHLPWHRDQWRSVAARLVRDTLPHALLLAGPAGVGKRDFAQRLAQAALCEQRDAQGEACGGCRACRLFAVHNHPDLRVVAPSEPGKAIGVDQVREAVAFLAQTAQYGGYKLLIIDPTDAMNVNAANALLKTLEEPSAHSLLLLVSAHRGRLPATIVSRCQRLSFTTPAPALAREWLAQRCGAEEDLELLLALAEGAPLRAVALREGETLKARGAVLQGLRAVACGEEICSVADRLSKHGVQLVLYWMYLGIADMIRLHAAADAAALINRDSASQLAELARRIATPPLHRFLNELRRGLSLAERPLNPLLLLEDILLSWQALFCSSR